MSDLDKVLDTIDADLDAALERLFATLPVLSHVEIARGAHIKSLGTIS